MQIFLSTTYSDFCDKNYCVKSKYKLFFEQLLSKIRNKNHKCYLAMERENWGHNFIDCKESVLCDYEAISNSDLTIMLLHYPISGGAHVELGWLSALKKKVAIFLQEGGSFSPVVKGISSLTNATFYKYKDYDQKLIDDIMSVINKNN